MKDEKASRSELTDKVAALAKEAKGAGELPLAGILFSVAGAMHAGAEIKLLEACVSFSRAELERLTGEPDWSQDTLKV